MLLFLWVAPCNQVVAIAIVAMLQVDRALPVFGSQPSARIPSTARPSVCGCAGVHSMAASMNALVHIIRAVGLDPKLGDSFARGECSGVVGHVVMIAKRQEQWQRQHAALE